MKPLKPSTFSGPAALFFCLAIGAAYSVHKGQDAAWDLKNYHLYNAWAFLHGRLAIDLAPVGLQGFFNPLLDIPYFWLGTGPLHDFPRTLAALQGLWFGGLIFVLLRIAVRFSELREREFGLPDLFAVAIGATGTMALSQAGSTTNEMPVALMVVTGFYALMPFAQFKPHDHGVRRIVLAAFLFGVAAGLKPTAVVYTPAMGIALWLGMGGRIKAFRTSAIFLALAFAGFLIAYGWWGWRLFQLTGNPVFPMFNQIFHSTWVPLSGGTDRQFMPKSLLQWFFYPFYWLHRNSYQGGNKFADPRYAVALIASVFVIVTVTLRRLRRKQTAAIDVFLIAFVVVSYILWLLLYSILRYAVPIEILTGLVIVLAAQEMFERVRAGSSQGKIFPWTVGLLAMLLIGCSRYPDWGHTSYSKTTFNVRPGAVQPESLVVLLGQPNAYLIPFFENARNSQFVGVTWLTAESEQNELWAMTRDRLRNYEGSVYLVSRTSDGVDRAEFMKLLPKATFKGCRLIESALERTVRGTDLSDGLQLCEVSRS